MFRKVTILMGRGIEGCGVTKYTVELCKYLEKNGVDYTIVASKDKSWSRKNAHTLKNVQLFKFADDSNLETIINTCNGSELVIINSLPSRPLGASSGHAPQVSVNFKKIIASINKPLVLVQHDHNKLSIIRNDGLEEAVKKADILFAHSDNNDFVKIAKGYMGEGNALMDLFGESSEKKILTFQPGMYFDEVKEKYWKPIEQVDATVHRWIGRTTFWKGYILMAEFHKAQLQGMNHCSIMEGIEKSPAYLDFRVRVVFHNLMDQNPDDLVVDKYRGSDIIVYTHFKNSELLERMSKTGFGYQLSVIAPHFIKHSIEYTHCEVASVGTIPVFRKEYGEQCIHRKTGNPMIKDPAGTLWLSSDNMEAVATQIKSLAQDPIARDEMRNQAFEYYRAHQDADFIFKEFFEQIESTL